MNNVARVSVYVVVYVVDVDGILIDGECDFLVVHNRCVGVGCGGGGGSKQLPIRRGLLLIRQGRNRKRCLEGWYMLGCRR